MTPSAECHACRGSGWSHGDECPRCCGSGHRYAEVDAIPVRRVPVGATERAEERVTAELARLRCSAARQLAYQICGALACHAPDSPVDSIAALASIPRADAGRVLRAYVAGLRCYSSALAAGDAYRGTGRAESSERTVYAIEKEASLLEGRAS